MGSNAPIIVDDRAMHQVVGLDSGNGESSTATLGLEAEETPLLPDAKCEMRRPNALPEDTAAAVMEEGQAALIRILPGLFIRLLSGQAPNSCAHSAD